MAPPAERRPLRVFMMDLLSIVPYYDGHLCAALARDARLEVTLGAIAYQHDRGYFRRQGVLNRPGLDVAARLPMPGGLRRPLKAAEAVLNLATVTLRLLVRRPDVLHVQFLPLLEVGVPLEQWALRIARALRIAIVHTVHNVLPSGSDQTRHRRAYGDVYRAADALICHDESAKARLLREFDVPAERIMIIPHGPFFSDDASETQAEARRRLRLNPAECIVLWQGIVEPYKGLDVLLKAWRQVFACEGTARLAIVGPAKSNHLDALRDLIRDLRIGSSTHLELSFVPVDRLCSWHRACDILVYPYQRGTTSGALMTGISYGKPIIATTVPAMTHLLRHGENALLVEHGDVEALSAALLRLVRDHRLRRMLGEASRETWATVPQWPEIGHQTRACYEQVVARRQAESGSPASWRGRIRDAAAVALHATGANRLLGRVATGRHTPLVLAYHRVVDDFASAQPHSIPAMLISRAMLARQLSTLMSRYRFVSLDELARQVRSGQPFDTPTAAVTFDDGYRDFYHTAFPLLQELGIPAAVFVVTESVGSDRQLIHDVLYDQLRHLFASSQQPSGELARLLQDLAIDAVRAERMRALAVSPLAAMRALYLTLSGDALERIVEALPHANGLEVPMPSDRRPLTWEMLRDMQQAGVTIGSHTRSHPILTNETPRTVRDEVAGSKQDLEAALGTPVRHFAYPGGYFRSETVRAVADAAYEMAYTTCIHRDPKHTALTVPRKLLWERSCLDARGNFSAAVMHCKVTWSFDLLRGCAQNHA
jgi:glycosyltransferase involved in cell wall biosynthesis/peptidoglycan/xylan/chitin deacetylase (PgdA/CDA1 family)